MIRVLSTAVPEPERFGKLPTFSLTIAINFIWSYHGEYLKVPIDAKCDRLGTGLYHTYTEEFALVVYCFQNIRYSWLLLKL